VIEIVFLGTSASAPSIHRGLSAHIVFYKNYRFLVDCGEGTQRQILRSGLGFKRLNRILLTHGHLDHMFGLGGLVSTFARWEPIEHLEIYGGSWALQRVHDLIYGVVLRGAKSPLKGRVWATCSARNRIAHSSTSRRRRWVCPRDRSGGDWSPANR